MTENTEIGGSGGSRTLASTPRDEDRGCSKAAAGILYVDLEVVFTLMVHISLASQLLRVCTQLGEEKCRIYCPSTSDGSMCTRRSPGWHSNSRQTASNVENRIARALLVFKFERFAIEIPTRSERSVRLIFRLKSMKSS